MAGGMNFWDTRKAAKAEAPTKGDPTATAFILHALRRYEDPLGQGFRAQRTWLAEQLTSRRALTSRPHTLALIGLALTPPAADSSPPQAVIDAVNICVEGLVDWRRKERGLVVNRPVFHGYQLGDQTEYILLNPELLAALFFLRRGNPIKARGFVLSTTAAVAQSVETNSAFEGQPGAEPTVDQMWAVKLLRQFGTMHDSAAEKALLRPRMTAALRLTWWNIALLILLMAFAVYLTASLVLGPLIAFALAGLVNVLVALKSEQR